MLNILLLYLILLLIGGVIAFMVYLSCNKYRKCALKGRGPEMMPFLGNHQLTNKDPIKSFNIVRDMVKESQDRGDGYFRFLPFSDLYISGFDPQFSEAILTSTKTIPKHRFYELLHVFLGTGLLTSGGDKWRKRRKLLTPSFHFSILQNFEETFKREGANAVRYLAKPENRNDCNIHDFVAYFTLNMVTETAMGTILDEIPGAKEYRKNLNASLEELAKQVFNLLTYLSFTRRISGNLGRLERMFKPVRQFTRNIIMDRMKKFSNNEPEKDDENNENKYYRAKQRFAMLDSLIQAYNIGEIDMNGIQDEVDTFLFEGLDTTSNTLMFTFLCLANYQDMQQQIYEEICECLGTREFDELHSNDFANMVLLDRFMKESLRLYPPVPLVGRTATKDFEYDGMVYPKGTYFQVMIYDLHRNPKYYPEPNKFDPDRFLPEETAKRHPFAYIPFSSGHRNCIGQKFALLEMKYFIVSILYHYRVETKTKMEDLKFIFNIVLRLVETPNVNFIPRCKTE